MRSAEKAAAELREGGSRHSDALKKAQADVHAALQEAKVSGFLLFCSFFAPAFELSPAFGGHLLLPFCVRGR